jgi:hypothetical protein
MYGQIDNIVYKVILRALSVLGEKKKEMLYAMLRATTTACVDSKYVKHVR